MATTETTDRPAVSFRKEWVVSCADKPKVGGKVTVTLKGGATEEVKVLAVASKYGRWLAIVERAPR